MGSAWTHLAAAAVGATAGWAAAALLADGVPPAAPVVPDEPTAVEGRVPTSGDAPGAAALRGSGASLDGLGATPEERRFLAEALTRERARTEAARIREDDTGIEVVRRMLEERADPAPVLASFDRFASHVRPVAAPVVRYVATAEDVTRTRPGKGVEGPLVVEFGPGTFEIGEDIQAWEKTPNVTSIEIRGAGTDRTTLRPRRGLLDLRIAVPHVRLSGLTFDLGSSNVVLRDSGDTAVVFEDVRFEGTALDGRADTPLVIHGRSYLGFRRCEFRHLDGAVAVHGEALLLFEDCSFEDVTRGFWGSSGSARGTRVRLVGCAWRDSPVAGSNLLHRGVPEYVVEVHGGRVALDRAGLADEERRRRWGAEYVRVTAPVGVGPSETARTLAVALDLIENVPQRDEVVTAVRFLVAPRGAGPVYRVSLHDRKKSRTDGVNVRVGSGTYERSRGSGGADAGAPPPDALRLAEVLRRSGLPPTTPVDRVQYVQQFDGSSHVPAVSVSWRNTNTLFRASDGNPLQMPWPSSW